MTSRINVSTLQALFSTSRQIRFNKRTKHALLDASLFIVILAITSLAVRAATLPTGFAESQVVSGLVNPTAMEFAPDGRLFVCQQEGQVRVIKNGVLLSAPFMTLTTDPSGERGLLGLAFDPNFSTDHFIYFYYTVASAPLHNRVSRFTANGDSVVSGSEVVILELNNLSGATNHNGGAMHFGPDGKLYIAVGENATPSNSQTLSNLLGKILRINADGSIPADNPFFSTATAQNRAIWALGLRNPFTFAFQPGTQRMFINDVGQSGWEEINDGIGGSNYGWPDTEGPTMNPNFRSPLFAYGHGSGNTTGCAITGGTFYNPPVNQFPAAYVGHYFFADFCTGWIRKLNPADNSVTGFATGIASPVDLRVGPEGDLYYLARGSGAIFKIQYVADQAPSISVQPLSQTTSTGRPVTFSVTASGTGPFSYQWQRNNVDIAGAQSRTYTIASVTAADNNAQFRVIVANAIGTATSNSATLTVSPNTAPTGNINTPASGTLYSAGQTINYSGTGTDPEDGSLPASAFTWQVDFHHDTHVHPFIPATSGATTGSFVVPASGETASNVWYRIILTVRDSQGVTHTSFRDITPRTVTLSLLTAPAGLQVTLDGQPLTTPSSIVGVVGMTRTLGVVSPQTVGGKTYQFSSWSDGGAATHNISTPAGNATFTATFTEQPAQSVNVFEFSAAQYDATEAAGSVPIAVRRSGNVSLAATVEYATVNGSATDRGDYTTALGTLSFAPGETLKTFDVLITDDRLVEGNESLSLTLSNPTGGFTLGDLRAPLLVISDNDTSPSNVNPIDAPQFFVRQHYHDFLNREPDQGGLVYWTEQLSSCGNDAVCRDFRRTAVSAAFFVEQEFQQTGFFLYRFHKATLGVRPSYLQFSKDRGSLQSASDLEAGKQAFAEAFVQRPEFTAKYGAASSCADFVDALVGTVRQGSGVEMGGRRSELIGECNIYAGSTTVQRARVVRKLIEYAELIAAEYNPAFVLAEYFGFLRREPDDAGYQFWLDVVRNRDPNNYLGMVQAFIISREYRERFGLR
jgi:glucose/arabinose dehydrogenase